MEWANYQNATPLEDFRRVAAVAHCDVGLVEASHPFANNSFYLDSMIASMNAAIRQGRAAEAGRWARSVITFAMQFDLLPTS